MEDQQYVPMVSHGNLSGIGRPVPPLLHVRTVFLRRAVQMLAMLLEPGFITSILDMLCCTLVIRREEPH